MIEDDLNDAIEERFDPFEKDILAKIRCHNISRRKWGIWKLEQIKEKFHRIGWSDESISTIRKAKLKIEDFYTKFYIEVNIAEKMENT